jgi:hypothetical protein
MTPNQKKLDAAWRILNRRLESVWSAANSLHFVAEEQGDKTADRAAFECDHPLSRLVNSTDQAYREWRASIGAALVATE